MKVRIYSIELVCGVEGEVEVKIEYEAFEGPLRIIGRLTAPVEPMEAWKGDKVKQVILEDLKSKRKEIIAIKEVVKNYKGQNIDLGELFAEEDDLAG